MKSHVNPMKSPFNHPFSYGLPMGSTIQPSIKAVRSTRAPATAHFDLEIAGRPGRINTFLQMPRDMIGIHVYITCIYTVSV